MVDPPLDNIGFHLAGLSHHDLAVAAAELFNLGYRWGAVRIAASRFDPTLDQWADQACAVATAIDGQLRVVLDADGRFLADPWDRTAPRLADSLQTFARESMLVKAIQAAPMAGAEVLTFSVGRADDAADSEGVLRRLASAIERLLTVAIDVGVTIAIRPESGSEIETTLQWERLMQWMPSELARSPRLTLAADVGVMASKGEMPIGDRLARVCDRLGCVYLSDPAVSRGGDARFGRGELAMARIVQALVEFGYQGPLIVCVEGYADIGLELAIEAMAVIKDVR